MLKHKLEAKGGPLSLTPPVVIGNLISYKGFKELGFIQGSSGELWSLDLDIDRMFWHKQLASASTGCAGGAMSTPTLTPPPDFSARPRPTPGPSPGIPASPAASPVVTPKPSILGSTAFGAPRPAFALGKDGRLHVLNTSTGEDLTAPIPFVPPNSRASSLAIADGSIYTTTVDCSGKTGAVWALDLDGEDRKPASYELKGAVPAGIAGLSVGRSHAVYVAGSDGSLAVLASKTLKETAKWPGSGKKSLKTAPLVFTVKDRDMIVLPDGDGRLTLLDSQQLSTPVYQTPPLGTVWGGISSWVDTDETRYIAVPVWGPVNPDVKFPASDGSAADGSILTFKVEESKLTPVWDVAQHPIARAARDYERSRIRTRRRRAARHSLTLIRVRRRDRQGDVLHAKPGHRSGQLERDDHRERPRVLHHDRWNPVRFRDLYGDAERF